MAEIKYQRLTRGRSRFSVAVLSRSSLWLGPDHLLYVESNGYAENYKRFYFRDIQGFVLEKTTTARTVNIVLGIVMLFFVFCGLLAHDQDWKTFLLIMAGIFGVILFFCALPGASCRCQIRTAVQIEQLASLARLRRSRQILDRIRPLITAAQAVSPAPENIPAAQPGMAPSPSPYEPAATEPPAS